MANIYKSITELVGKTPLLELSNYEAKYDLKARILVKLEYYNPNQSVKDRIALRTIEEAERKGELQPGDTIVEMTSGNTGIGLAAIAAAKGYKFRSYIQDEVSIERYQVIHAFGGETIGMTQEPVIAQAMEEHEGDFVKISLALRDKVIGDTPHTFYADQTANPCNPGAHEATTGPEIWEDTDGELDIFVATVGTGGTISGTGKFLKEKNPDIQIVAVQPGPDSMPSETNPAPEEIIGIHPFVGVDPEKIPQAMDLNIYDEVLEVDTPDAYRVARELARTEGLLLGTSSGAAVHAATLVAQKPENAGKTIVVIAPDTGLRYLSTNLFNPDYPA